MPVIAFDTLAYSQKLQEGGIPREQAEAIARANVDAFRSLVVTQQLATKDDIAEVKQEISELRQETKKDNTEVKLELAGIKQNIVHTKYEILIWFIGLMVALGGAIIGYMNYFLK